MSDDFSVYTKVGQGSWVHQGARLAHAGDPENQGSRRANRGESYSLQELPEERISGVETGAKACKSPKILVNDDALE